MRSKSQFGMWLFLAGEVLIFGSLIVLFEIFFSQNEEIFKEASSELHFYHGTINTLILLTSSYFVALGLAKKKSFYIIITFLLGLAFLGIKSHEYYDLIQEGKFVSGFSPGLMNGKKLFFVLYQFMTMLHALHVIGGLVLVLMLSKSKNFESEFSENTGLYWHFVDLVWVYLYPLFYLLGH